MAKLWPRTIPPSIRGDQRRRAEVRVYDKLAQVLDDGYTIFYSSPWLGTDHLGNEKDGECDFMVAHPALGYLAIEVKGGGISYDPAERQWWSTDGTFRFRIKDPVEQARSAKHELLKKLKDLPGWGHRWVHTSHGVIFPSADVVKGQLGADRPPNLFCCAREFTHDLRAWIVARMKYPEGHPNTERFGKDGIAALERVLAQPFTLAFRISAAMEDAREHLGTLEPQQFHVLQQIAEIPRAEIKGGAGTGKTVLAIREARLSAEKGRRTLLTCYSQPLANELKRQAGVHEHLTVGSLHEVSIDLLRYAGCETPPSSDTAEALDSKLPELVLDVLSLRPDLQWECVVIDEAQDIFANWWIAIDSAIASSGNLRVFTDTNQRLYTGKTLPAADLRIVPIRLLRNLRNTKSIHSAASMHYEGPQIIAEGPDGLPVNWIKVNSSSEMATGAYAEVRRLVYHQDVSPSDIAVLLSDPSMVDAFLLTASRSELEFASCDDLQTDSIVVDTIKRFKGLERPAIIIVAGSGTAMMPELAYVGFSRPRYYLSVVALELETRWLQEGFATNNPNQ